MKTFFKFSGLIAAALAIVAIILMMATPSLIYVNGDNTYSISGIAALFGEDVKASYGAISATLGHINNAWTAILAWILVLVGAVALLVVSILPLFKVNALDKFAGIIALVSAIVLLVAGILLFFTQPAMNAANASDLTSTPYKDYGLGAGYVIGAILSIVGGAVAVCPTVANLIKK